MKKFILIWLFLWCIIMAWCHNHLKDTINNEPIKWDYHPEGAQICEESEWEVTTDYFWKPLCIFLINKECYLEDIENWNCERLNQEKCTEEYNPVCWADWKLYSNRCFMEIAWVQEADWWLVMKKECNEDYYNLWECSQLWDKFDKCVIFPATI